MADPDAPPSRPAVSARFGALADRAIAVRSTRARRTTYLLAVVLFAVTAAAGFASLPEPTDDARPLLFVVVALVVAPGASVCNALEYALTARYAGSRVRAGDAMGVAVLSTAANLLPLPGAAMVRAAALRRLGTSYAKAAGVTIAASGAWLATTALLAGAVLVSGGRVAPGAALGVVGAAGVVVAHRVAGAHHLAGGVRLTACLVAVEAANVTIGAVRLWLCITGLGLAVDAVQATVLTLASVLASAAGVFPSGLGLREAIASGLGPLVGLPAAVGAAGSALDRLLGLPVVLVAAAGFALAGGGLGGSRDPH
jgi:hypothetical protein